MRRLLGTIGLTGLMAVGAPVAVAGVVGVGSTARAAHASESARKPVVERLALDESTVLSSGGKLLLSIITAGANRCVISASPAIKGLRTVVPCARGMTFVSFKIPPNPRDAVVRYRISVRAARRGASSPVVTTRLVQLAASRSSSQSFGAAQAASPFASPGDFAKFALSKALRYAAGKVGVPGDALGFLLQQVGLEAKPEGFKPVLEPLDKLAAGINALQASQNAFQVFLNDDEFKVWSGLNHGFEINLNQLKEFLDNIAALVANDPDNKDSGTQQGINDNVRNFLTQYHIHALELQGDIGRFASWLGVQSNTYGPDYYAVDLFARHELHGRRYATSRDSDQIRLFSAYVENLQALALAINEIALGQPPNGCVDHPESDDCTNHNASQARRIATAYVQDVSRENARLPLRIPENAAVDLQTGTASTDKLMWLPALGGGACCSIHLLTWWLPVAGGVTLPTYPQYPTPRRANELPTYTYLQYEATGAPSGNQTDNRTDPPTDHEATQAGFTNWVVASRDEIKNFVAHSAVNYNPATTLGSYLTTIDPGSSWDHLTEKVLTSTPIGYKVPVSNKVCVSGFDVTSLGFFDLAKAQNIDSNFYHQDAPVDIDTNNAAFCATKVITGTGFIGSDFNDTGSVLLVRRVDPDRAMGVDYLGNRVDASPGPGENVYQGADLAGANLSGLDLSGPLNPQTNTAGAPIEGDPALFANFTSAKLTRANLAGDNLSGQDFTGTNLTDANLKGVDLSNANLMKATLQGISSGAVAVQPDAKAPALPSGWMLKDGYLVGPHANLDGAKLAGVDLAGADLSGAHLVGANLAGADLSGANLAGAHLNGANLVDANLDRATLTDATLELVRSGGITGTPSRLPNNWRLTANGYLAGPRADLQAANLKGEVLNGSDLAGVLFKNANLEGAHLTGATITGANFDGARLEGVQSGGLIGLPARTPLPVYVGGVQAFLENLTPNWKVVDGYLVGPSADLDGANLDGADFTAAHVNPFLVQPLSLAGAHLTNAHLVGANLTGANLKGASLSGVDLTRANLTNADLSGASNLASAHVDATTIWANTTCPDGTNSNAHAKTCVGH